MLQYFDQITYFNEDQWYKAIRSVFPTELQYLGDEELETLFKKVLTNKPPVEQQIMIESIGKIARDIGNFAKKNAGVIGTVGGTVLGTIVGGPVGAAAGAKLGGSLGNQIQGNKKKSSRKRSARQSKVSRQATSTPSKRSPELKSLMLANNPQFLIGIIQAIVKNNLKDILRGKSIGLAEQFADNDSSKALEAFYSAIAVFAEEMAIKYNNTLSGLSSPVVSSPKERAEALYSSMYHLD